MRPTHVIIREACDRNRRTFSNRDRARAEVALDIYMREINEHGLRCEFDYYPDSVGELLASHNRHRNEIDRLRAGAKKLKELIKLLEKLKNRPAVELNPLWWRADDAAETITRTLHPLAIPTYRVFHAAVVAYLDELGKKKPDWAKVNDLALQVAYTVNGNEWRETGVQAPQDGICHFDTRWFLQAILAEPKKTTD